MKFFVGRGKSHYENSNIFCQETDKTNSTNLKEQESVQPKPCFCFFVCLFVFFFRRAKTINENATYLLVPTP